MLILIFFRAISLCISWTNKKTWYKTSNVCGCRVATCEDKTGGGIDITVFMAALRGNEQA
jgi:hypothetical protein